MILDEKLSNEYKNLFDTLIIQPGWLDDVESDVESARRGKARYEKLGIQAKCPWFIVAIIHKKECAYNFHQHLHNGDDLSKRTVQIPVGRPVKGEPPFTFEASALDALEYDKVSNVKVWDLPGCLFFFEKYNGFAYRPGMKGYRTTPLARSPYLWAGSQHWQKGKFVKDRVFDPEAGSKNLGAAVLLKALEMKGLVNFTETKKLV